MVGACSNDGVGDTPGTTAVSTAASSTSPTSTLPPVVECPGGGEFGEGGGISEIDGNGTDAGRLGRISWEASDPCESFVFEFETPEGAPATTVPNIEISHLESFQVIRIQVDIADTVITDQLVETDLVDRLYVVRRLDGGMFIDLHLAAPAAARGRMDASPARLIVDLRPGFVDFQGQATTGANVVVVSPAAGTTVDPVTQFMGYSRTPDANVAIVVTRGDEVVAEANTAAADDIETWGEFTTEMGLPPGEILVYFGEASPLEGSPQGITVDLTVS